MPSTIPGEAIENALGEVTSKAGNALVDGLGRTLGLLVAKRAARIEAEALEISSDIKHAGELRRMRDNEAERRSQELMEIEHRSLMERASSRLRNTFLDEQLKFEGLIDGAAKKIANDPENDNARELNTEWLRRFFRCAMDVDEKTILELFETALADATIAGRPIISNKALDILRYFDEENLALFLKISRIIVLFGYTNFNILTSSSTFGCSEDNLEILEEIGLIKIVNVSSITIPIGSFKLNFSHNVGSIHQFSCLKLTQAGVDILKILDRELHSLISHTVNSELTTKFWEFQKKNVSFAHYKSMTYNILGEIVGSIPLEIRLIQDLLEDNNHEYYAINTIRTSKTEKFNIKEQSKIRKPCFGEEFIECIFETSFDFDENVLPILIANEDII